MDYAATILTSAPHDQVARMIAADVELWWSTRVERHRDGFTVRFNASHASFSIDSGGSDQDFSWTCTDAHMIIDGVADADEWTGTNLVWHIDPVPGGSAVTLTHKGLTPDIACFDVCTRGWQHFFETSLRNHLNGDTAHPETSAGAA